MDRVKVIIGDITKVQVNAIVNAANERMLGGGGVDGAIHRAAGYHLLEACRRFPEVRPGVRCPTGTARITPGYNLPASHVIHAVGPIWRGGDHGEDEALAKCYQAIFKLAGEHELQSVALPAISCGVYRFPPERAARIAIREVLALLEQYPSVTQVVLVAFDEAMGQVMRAALESQSA